MGLTINKMWPSLHVDDGVDVDDDGVDVDDDGVDVDDDDMTFRHPGRNHLQR